MPFDPTAELVHAVLAALEAVYPRPWPRPVLLAVSGGADSMALLHLLHRGGVPVAVAHFDHQTRDGASTREGDFVADQARALGVPCHRGGADIGARVAASGDSFEMAARDARYAYLSRVVTSEGYGAIATGHHADDQAETVLLRLLRGTSPAGLAGIAPVRLLHGVTVVRPLLQFRRVALEAWLEAAGLGWMEDGSNADTTIARNRVRHDLLPDLARDFNPRIVEALNRLAALQAMDNACLEAQCRESGAHGLDRSGRIDRDAFRAQPDAIQHRLVTRWIRDAGGEADYETACRVVDVLASGRPGQQTDLGNGQALYLGETHGIVGPLERRPVDVSLSVPGAVTAGGFRVSCRPLAALPAVPLAQYCTPGRQVVDRDALADPVRVRTRRPGDRFQPMGMEGTRKLKDYFNSLGLTRIERDRQLLVVSGDRIVWVVGHAISGAAAVSDHTRAWIEIEVTPETA